MSIPKKPFKLTRNLFRRIRKLYDVTVKALANSVLRTLQRSGRRPHRANAGFALPTTIMVLLVVILLTTALVFRSFDRNKNAVLSRSEQVIQNTSTPALDRAKAKLTELLADPKLPRGTPADSKLLEVMNQDDYTFKDETRLKLAFDFGDGQGGPTPDGNIEATGDQYDETINTAWKYPVDTDGNGKFDAFTLYGLYWRSPNRDQNTNNYARGRVPLEARSLPQDTAGIDQCKTALQSAATAVQQGDWINQGGKLSKAFYIYAATVPITDKSKILPGSSFSLDKFENNTKGQKAFSGLEYEQDRYRSGLNNTAVWYEDDLIINPGRSFRLNGKVFTNSNLLIAGVPGSGQFNFFQVSSKYSCFYKDQENSKIIVGGNVGTGDISQDTSQESATVDLYRGFGNSPIPSYQPKIDDSTKSTDQAGGSLIAYNQAAYNKRITLMRDTAMSFCSTGCYQNPPAFPTQFSDPDLQQSITTALANNSSNAAPETLVTQQVEIYLRNRTRRVPYAEISAPDGTGAEAPYTPRNGINTSVFTTGIEPPDNWRNPLSGNSFINTSGTSVSLVTSNLPQTYPDSLTNKQDPPEDLLGDRVNVGNNLPAFVKDPSTGKYSSEVKQPINGATWTAAGGGTTRYRMTQVQALDNLGVTDRNGFWESAAAVNPNDAASNNTGGGGLRIVTGAGIYVDGTKANGAWFPRDAFLPRNRSFLPQPDWDTRFVDPSGTDRNRINPRSLKFRAQNPIIVWSDLMPMTGGNTDINGDSVKDSRQNGDLLMRATAVYHYADNAATKANPSQTPIACVSSYYDPTNSTTSRNSRGLPDVSGGIDLDGDTKIDQPFGGGTLNPAQGSNAGNSNNGVVYSWIGSSGNYQSELVRQALLVFPDGRIVNQPLRDALNKNPAARTLADQSAIDSAICAIAILKGQVQPNPIIPHGSIKEASFLDAREVKAIDKLTPLDPSYSLNSNYDLPLEQRQPLEVRVTDINVGLLAGTSHKTTTYSDESSPIPEYLLPNSGIIYASRDDALPDNSNQSINNRLNNNQGGDTNSPSDFRLDPTRRPNGIRLINGLRLARGDGNQYNVHEKGLILATNLPAYIKGNFNLHLESKATQFSGASELEEFNTTLSANWDNFYDRGNTSANGGLNRKFACRQNQPLCTGNGDQWRPATILSDAITLQSSNFQDGYRNQGDFDLRNNSGNTLAGSRVAQGFFDNSFVTSANWINNGTLFPDSTYKTSYLVNGITPIQRRARVFAYQTEICQTIPVSECKAAEWQSNPNLDTSKIAPPRLQGYARRVAFQKVADSNPKLFKYYYDSSGYPKLLNVSSAPQLNTLWFRTRNINNGSPGFYAGDVSLYNEPEIFQPPEMKDLDLGVVRGYLAAGQTNSQAMPLPPTIDTPVTSIAGPPVLAVQQQLTKIYNAVTTPSTTSPLALTKRNPLALPAQPDPNTLPSSKKTELTGGGVIGVYTLSTNQLNSTNKLTLKGDAGSVYVFVVSSNLIVQQGGLDLGQVPAENVYWIVSGPVRVLPGSQLQGNVITPSSITLSARAKLEGRALSIGGTVTLNGQSNNIANIVAPSGSQPRLIPVTQIQSPSGRPAVVLDPGDTSAYPTNWLQKAQSTNYNVAFFVGDSPPRPEEKSAGLNNLVRLQENWQDETVTIKGSFIQQKRSSFATAPYSAIRQKQQPPVIEGTDGGLTIFPNPIAGSNRPNGYWTSNGSNDASSKPGQLPYFNTPTRQWGFDVGLLSQSPDLFSQRFTQEISKNQNYYRQVGRDDDWIKTLLCAAEPSDPTKPDSSYGNYAVQDSERPDCQKVTHARLPLPNPPSS